MEIPSFKTIFMHMRMLPACWNVSRLIIHNVEFNEIRFIPVPLATTTYNVA
jgi:hypothetical protein